MTRHKVMVVLAGTMIAMGAGMPLAAAAPAGHSIVRAGWKVQRAVRS